MRGTTHMNDLMDAMDEAHGGSAVESLARAFNVTPDQAQAALAVVLPKLTQGLEDRTLSSGGLADVVRSLGATEAHSETITSPGGLLSPQVSDHGNAMLDTVLGGGTAQSLAGQAAVQSGISGEIMRRMMPAIAAMVMGGIAKRAVAGGLGNVLGQAGSAGGVNWGQIAGSVLQRSASGGVSTAVRGVLANQAGFSNRGGWIGWLIRLIVIRIGWGLVRGVIRNVLVGRR